jgi:hypothetical protein
MPQSIGDQIAGAVHQGLPTGADANTAQLIAIMQMLSKAGEHTRDIAQWWEERPVRKQRRDEALRDILFQDVLQGKRPPEELDPEGMIKFIAAKKSLNASSPDSVSAEIDSIRVGGRLASAGAANVPGGVAELTMGDVDNTISRAISQIKTTNSKPETIEKETSNLIQKLSISNPEQITALYTNAMKTYNANPEMIAQLSPAQQAVIAETSKNGPMAKGLTERLAGLVYTVDRDQKSETYGTLKPTALFNSLTGENKKLQSEIISHLEAQTGGATLDKKMMLNDDLFPREEASNKRWNPYTKTFDTEQNIAKGLADNPMFKAWAIENKLSGSKQTLPPSVSPFGETVYDVGNGKFIKATEEPKGTKSKKEKKDVKGSLPSVIEEVSNTSPTPDLFDMEGMFETGAPPDSSIQPYTEEQYGQNQVQPYTESQYEQNQIQPYTEAQYEQNQLNPSAYPLPGAPPPTAVEYQKNQFGGAAPTTPGPNAMDMFRFRSPSAAEYQKNQFGGGPSTNPVDDFIALLQYGPSATRDYINSKPSGADQDLARFQEQMANKAPGRPTIGSDLEAIAAQGPSGLRDYINNPGPRGNLRDYLSGTGRIESDFLPPVETEPGIGMLKNLSKQEQIALLELLAKLKSGVGAQQSPASGQYPGTGYGLRVR